MKSGIEKTRIEIGLKVSFTPLWIILVGLVYRLMKC
jgi:hypothetical protein